MNRCPITYELCGDQKYSEKGLKLLSKSLKALNDFPYSAKEQIRLAAEAASKLSIQGVQPKLSVILNVKQENFEIVERGGRYIIKPPHELYQEIPQNEDLTMRLAKTIGIQVPLHGLIYNIDGSLSYFIKRFDRARSHKLGQEDFSQLLGYSRETKYESSMEKIISVIEKHCTFPALDKLKLFRLVIFNFIIGNEDMHLKNYTLLRQGNLIALSPAYDLLNTTIIMKVEEEIALPLNGKKKKLKRIDLVDYFGIGRLGLPEVVVNKELLKIKRSLDKWNTLLQSSFLSEKMRQSYAQVIQERLQRLEL